MGCRDFPTVNYGSSSGTAYQKIRTASKKIVRATHIVERRAGGEETERNVVRIQFATNFGDFSTGSPTGGLTRGFLSSVSTIPPSRNRISKKLASLWTSLFWYIGYSREAWDRGFGRRRRLTCAADITYLATARWTYQVLYRDACLRGSLVQSSPSCLRLEVLRLSC
ncbi:hypothetical protein PLICRDRAFT_624204 [Plicaturopsis crispa FD-325 SS-3]|nr:hypothetical protein PLICRDRAFT_624204 [Plicaturopsis crispa FD-325 SS-3]